MNARDAEVRRLRRARPRDRVLRGTAWVLGGLAVASFASGTFRIDDLLSERRMRNLDAFLTELVPYPLRTGAGHGLGDGLAFYGRLLADGGARALGVTVAISVAAAVLAGVLGACAAPLVARNLVRPEPFLPGPRRPGRLAAWSFAAWIALGRGGLVFLRAIPEFVWAFLLVAVFGPGAWPAVLALAIHNAGILGRLGGEVLENVEPSPPRALRAIGATRLQTLAAALAPAAFPRFLAYFFYRWETCVREATILGMLGVVSLGYVVQEARAAIRYDELIFYVALGAVVVQVGDLVSSRARRTVRTSGG